MVTLTAVNNVHTVNIMNTSFLFSDTDLYHMGVILLYGVHGGGKTLVSKLVAQDAGIPYINVDPAEKTDVTKMDPFERQVFFAKQTLEGYLKAKQMKNVWPVLDFAPLHTTVYAEWFLNGRHRELNQYLWKEFMKVYDGNGIHVFFMIEKDYEVVLRRIKERNREGMVSEEADRKYIEFINSRMWSLYKRLKSMGERVYNVPADATIRKKINVFWDIVEEVVK